MFLRSFRSKALGRLTSCIKYLVLIQSLESSGILTLQEGESTFQLGPTDVKDRGDEPSTKGPISWLPLPGRLEEVTSEAVHLWIQDLIELFMLYKDWASRPLSKPWQQGSAFPAATTSLSACHSAHYLLESAKYLMPAMCFAVQLGDTVLKATHGSQSTGRRGLVWRRYLQEATLRVSSLAGAGLKNSYVTLQGLSSILHCPFNNNSHLQVDTWRRGRSLEWGLR